MPSRPPPAALSWALSVLLHGGLGLVLWLMPAAAKLPPPLKPIELTDRELPPEPEKPEPPEPKPPPPAAQPKVAMIRKLPRPTVQPPPEQTPEAKPTEPKSVEPTRPPTFGIKLEGTSRAPAGTGVQVPEGDTLLTKPTRKQQKKKPGKVAKTERRGFKADYEKGERAPLAVVTKMPKVQQKVIAEYPDKTKELGIEGRVVLQLSVDGKGRVKEARVVTALHPLLDAAAKAAALKMRFAPATVNGTPVAVKIPYTFTFVLD